MPSECLTGTAQYYKVLPKISRAKPRHKRRDRCVGRNLGMNLGKYKFNNLFKMFLPIISWCFPVNHKMLNLTYFIFLCWIS